MEEISTSQEQDLELTDKQIFTKIWTSPRKVFKYLNENQYDKYSYILLGLAGISRSFERAVSQNQGDDMSLGAIIALCVIIGGLLGWLSFYIYAALLNWTGKWFGSKGNRDSLLRMLSHAMIPSIIALVLLFLKIGLFGNGAFQSDIDIYQNGMTSFIVYFGTAILQIILGIWTIVIFIIGVSEIQKLSIGKSILNVILPGLIIIVPVGLIAFILGDLFK